MKKSAFLIGIVFITFIGIARATQPILVEMPMSEPWNALPDSDSITVLWHSDLSAILAVLPDGLEILHADDIVIDPLTEWVSDRDYYIVSSRSGNLPSKWKGLGLKNGQFLVEVPAGSILPSDRNLAYQRIRLTNRRISSLVPRNYNGYAVKDYSPLIQAFVDQVDGNYLHGLLEQMVAFVTRYSYSAQCVTAVNWAADEFESWGYDVELFPHTSGMAPNVIAWKHGLINPDTIWVVGGHFDSTSQSPSSLAPGADDNGTGSALTMCCADILQNLQFADTVIFALWTGEEQGLYGSDAWATWAAGENLDIQGYFNFDMVGWVDPYPEDLEVLVNNASLSFGQDFVDVTEMYTSLPYNLEVTNVTASDHYSFWQQGYASFCGIEDYWPTYPYYHTTDDTVDKVDIPFLTDVTKAMVANVCTAAQLAESMTFNQSTITCNGVLDLMVVDTDASGSIVVQVHSDSEVTPESFTLPEYSAFVFTGSVPLTDGTAVAGDGMISVSHGDTVIAEYSGVSNPAQSTVDCEPPIISNMTITDLTSTAVTISFDTDEPTTATIRFGQSIPDQMVQTSGSAMSHSVTIGALDDCTLYYFEIEAVDTAGNVTIDNSGGIFYFFITLERVVMLFESMDTDPGWTCQNQWAWGVPMGSSGDPSSGYTGSHVTGYNLAGSYANNMPETFCTTQAIDCSDASVVILGYYHWLGIESSTWDHASMRVSGNGGTSWTTIWDHDGGSVSPAGWTYSEYDISAVAAGASDVRVRWVMGTTDTSVVYCGWNIDDVSVFFEQACEISTPTPGPTATFGECLHTGDVNFSGEITAGDAQTAFQIAIGTISPTFQEECAADCNGDGTVTAGDAQSIFMSALGTGTCQDPI